jgi:hypothetical protein
MLDQQKKRDFRPIQRKNRDFRPRKRKNGAIGYGSGVLGKARVKG